MCVACGLMYKKGNYCTVCEKIYTDDQGEVYFLYICCDTLKLDEPMVCCDECDKWVHTNCDDIDELAYENYSNDDVPYKCPKCRLHIRSRNRINEIGYILFLNIAI
jgi:hypothetical protein